MPMCGRFSVSLPPDEVARYFQITGRLPNFPPKYNLAPTQDAPVVRLNPETKQRQLDLLRFGLVLHWAKEPFKPLINAQSETVHKKPAFARSFAERRCVVVADGFYEWDKATTPRQPYRFVLKSGAPMALAGVWSGKRLLRDTIVGGNRGQSKIRGSAAQCASVRVTHARNLLRRRFPAQRPTRRPAAARPVLSACRLRCGSWSGRARPAGLPKTPASC
jgi:putative SOS response-associated peptidase YedK